MAVACPEAFRSFFYFHPRETIEAFYPQNKTIPRLETSPDYVNAFILL